MTHRSSTFAIFLLLAAAIAVPALLPAPHLASSDRIDAATLAAWESEFRVRELTGIALDLPDDSASEGFSVRLPLDGVEHRVHLERHSVRSPEFRFFVQDDAGELVEAPAPEVRTYRGVVEGWPDARVRATRTAHGLRALVSIDAETCWYVRPTDRGTVHPAADHVVYRGSDQLLPEDWCSTLATSPEEDLANGSAPPTDASGGPTLYLTEIACDADYEFFVSKDEDVVDTTAHVEGSINDLIVFFERDLQITYQITAVVVRTTNPDPYSLSGDAGDMLREFRDHWNANHQDIQMDVAQLYTGRGMDARGIAWLNAICTNLRYSVVRGNDPAVDFVAGHELGHNWGAPHCTGNDCFIMCSGGPCAGGRAFGPGSTAIIFGYRNSIQGCLDFLEDPIAPPFVETFPQGSLDPARWFFSRGAAVTQAASNEPSAPFALDLIGPRDLEGFDEAQTRALFLEGVTESPFVSYYVQATGLDGGERILVDYLGSPNDWYPLETIFPSQTTSSFFRLHYHALPPNAAYGRFRLRFRTDFDDANDRLFVDNISVALTETSVDLVPFVSAVRAGQTFRFDAHVTNETDQATSATAWVDFFRPDGSPLFAGNPKFGPKTVGLSPGQTKSKTQIRVRVTASTPPGLGYRAVAYTGVFPDEIHHADEFFFQVTEPQ